MRVYVEEIKATTLEQTFAVTAKHILVERVRLHLVKYLSPAGTFTASITTDDDTVLVSKSQTLAEMQAAGSDALQENYYHGHVSFIFDTAITLRPGTYKLKLSASGYTYADGEFIGWAKAWDDRAIGVTGDATPVPANAPYDFEIYSLQKVK